MDDHNRRSCLIALVILIVGALLILVGFAMPWATARLPLVAGVATGTQEHEITGRDLFGGAAAAAWICLAGVAGIVATRSWGRSIVGGIVVLAGLAAAVASVSFVAKPDSSIATVVLPLIGSSAAVSSELTLWWLAGLAGGALGVIAGVWTMWRGRRWPAMGSRYERAPRKAAATSPWDAMDNGMDPTDEAYEPRHGDGRGSA